MENVINPWTTNTAGIVIQSGYGIKQLQVISSELFTGPKYQKNVLWQFSLRNVSLTTEKPLLDFFPYDTWFSSNYHPFSFIFCFCTLLFIPTMCKDRHLEKILYIYLYIWSIFIKRLPGSGPEAICWQPFLIPRLKAEKLISYKQTSKINHSICCWLSVKY